VYLSNLSFSHFGHAELFVFLAPYPCFLLVRP
jgi:hypothetical protein